MANIAVVFHWPPSEMYQMTLDDLILWNKKAVERWSKDED